MLTPDNALMLYRQGCAGGAIVFRAFQPTSSAGTHG
jgi:hypothetical protein